MHISITQANINNQKYIMKLGPDQCLISSIILESTSTCLLKNALHNNLYYIPAYTGYVLSFYFFPKSLEKYSLSFAYTLWCGVGILFTLFYELLFSNMVFTFKKSLGIIFMIIGIYFSK